MLRIQKLVVLTAFLTQPFNTNGTFSSPDVVPLPNYLLCASRMIDQDEREFQAEFRTVFRVWTCMVE